MKFLAQLKSALRGGGNFRRRDQAWVHFTAFSALAMLFSEPIFLLNSPEARR
jgi:hypothetical protein